MKIKKWIKRNGWKCKGFEHEVDKNLWVQRMKWMNIYKLKWWLGWKSISESSEMDENQWVDRMKWMKINEWIEWNGWKCTEWWVVCVLRVWWVVSGLRFGGLVLWVLCGEWLAFWGFFLVSGEWWVVCGLGVFWWVVGVLKVWTCCLYLSACVRE